MLIETGRKIIFDSRRCTQCGGCLAVCKTGSLKNVPAPHGLFTITWQEESCSHCLSCIRVCPAYYLPEAGFDPRKLDGALGFLLAFAGNEQIRRQASSGGAGRLLVKTALSTGMADLAYTLKKDASCPWAEGGFWQKGEDISQMPNSMYLPILVMKNLVLKQRLKSLLIVGTPCQLLAAEALVGKKVDRLYKVAIYCKQQKDFRATKYCAKRLNIPILKGHAEDIHNVSYRGDGWPGKVTVNQSSLAWEQAAGVPFGKRLWRVPGCRFCPDAFGFNVDLTLLDPWGIRQENALGETLVVVWTRQGQELLQNASGELQIENLTPEEGLKAINIGDMLQKAALVNYYLGRSVSLRTWLAGRGEEIQGSFYETILEYLNLPTLGHKLIAHAPDLRNMFLHGLRSHIGRKSTSP